jgi:hypothetical protein
MQRRLSWCDDFTAVRHCALRVLLPITSIRNRKLLPGAEAEAANKNSA